MEEEPRKTYTGEEIREMRKQLILTDHVKDHEELIKRINDAKEKWGNKWKKVKAVIEYTNGSLQHIDTKDKSLTTSSTLKQKMMKISLLLLLMFS